MHCKQTLQNRAVAFVKVKLSFLAALLLIANSVYAEEAGETLLKVILTDGTIEVFDRDRLDDFDQIEFITETLWTEGPHTYSGPSMMNVLSSVGITGGDIEIFAVNDYSLIADLESELIVEDAPIIATRIDGKEFPVWQKGPLWIMYPFDTRPELSVERAYALSVWQVVQIRQKASDSEGPADTGLRK